VPHAHARDGRTQKARQSRAGRELLPRCIAGIINLLSNNSDLALAPDELRKLAIPRGTREAPSEPDEFQIHRLSSRLSTEQIDDVVQRYEAGMTIAELEEKHGLSHGAVLRALHRSGVEMRAKAPRRKLE
jgi:DNA-directed RNA polymerase specialized sigma24 family protein